MAVIRTHVCDRCGDEIPQTPGSGNALIRQIFTPTKRRKYQKGEWLLRLIHWDFTWEGWQHDYEICKFCKEKFEAWMEAGKWARLPAIPATQQKERPPDADSN